MKDEIISVRRMDLALLHPALHEDAYRDIEERDAIGLVIKAGGGALAFVLDNRFALRDLGMFEPALISAFTGCRMNFNEWQAKEIEGLFKMCDRDKLWAAGDEPPPGDRWTVYRGVAGKRGQRKVRGLSWTSSRDQACWYALRLDLPDPAVYSATVGRQDVYCFSDDRDEQECICRPRSPRRLVITVDEMREGQSRIEQMNTPEAMMKRLDDYLDEKLSKEPCEALG